jgi:hypothetical protein
MYDTVMRSLSTKVLFTPEYLSFISMKVQANPLQLVTASLAGLIFVSEVAVCRNRPRVCRVCEQCNGLSCK